MPTLLSRLLDIVFRGRRDRRLADEVQSHLDFLTDEFAAKGMAPEVARLAALKSFGGVDQMKTLYREQRGLPFIDSISQDVRYAARGLRRTPNFTIVSVVILALAIGANAGVVSLLNALLLRELAVREPSSLVQVAFTTPREADGPLTYTMFQELSGRQHVFSAVMGWTGAAVRDVDIDGAIASAAVFSATGNWFTELGVRPAMGRLLNNSDMSLAPLSTEHVAVIGYRFWQRHLHADAGVIGRTIRINGVPLTIVGVAERGYSGVRLAIEPDVTIPLAAVSVINNLPVDTFAKRHTQMIRIVGRLAPGVSIEQARAQIEALWPEIREVSTPPNLTTAQRSQHSALNIGVTSMARGSEPNLRSQFSQPLFVVLGIAALVLAIACVNLASLTLARTVARSHEIATRLAIGATRWRVCRQLLVEAVMVSLAGGIAGVVAGGWVSGAVATVILADFNVPTSFDATPDANVIAITLAMAAVVGAIFSTAPCWWVLRQRGTSLRADRPANSDSGGFGSLLVAAQVALSIVLVVHAGLLVRSLQEVRAIDTGVQADDVAVAYTRPFVGGYANLDNDAYYPILIERLRSLPGVQHVSVSLLKPGGGGGIDSAVTAVGEDGGSATDVTRTPVAPDFFNTLGVPLSEGRDFSWQDNSRSRAVAIVSESLARRVFRGGATVGRHIRIGNQPRLQDVEIVGVVADSRIYNPKDGNLDAVYVAALQDPEDASYKCLVLRGASVSSAEIGSVVAALGHEYVSAIEPLNYIVGRTLLRERLTAAFGSFFGLLAVALSAIGIYGLMSCVVTRRRREAGIRLALGEEPRQLLSRVLRSAVMVAAIGTAAGLAISLVTVSLTRSMLFGIPARDPITFVSAAGIMAAVAVAAALLPAIRLARVDPMSALRQA